jgi:hypothetical protein
MDLVSVREDGATVEFLRSELMLLADVLNAGVCNQTKHEVNAVEAFRAAFQAMAVASALCGPGEARTWAEQSASYEADWRRLDALNARGHGGAAGKVG